MENKMLFTFKNKVSECTIEIDSHEPPSYVFVVLTDHQLIELFGAEVTLKTDFKCLLPRQDDYAELIELRLSLFEALQTNPEYLIRKSRLHV